MMKEGNVLYHHNTINEKCNDEILELIESFVFIIIQCF